MREIDAKPIEDAYNEWKNGRKKLTREHHRLEQLRDQLVEGNNQLLNQLIQDHPDIDIQQFRQTIRLAQQERKQEKPPKHYRKLFQMLKALKTEQTDSTSSHSDD